MNIRNQKGFTGIDMIIGLISLSIFIVVITVMITKYNSQVLEMKLKSQALEYAITEIEDIKAKGYIESYNGLGIKDVIGDNKGEYILNDKSKDINNQEIVVDGKKTGFYKTISIKDYKLENSGAIKNYVKEITVKISYMYKSKLEFAELSTVISIED